MFLEGETWCGALGSASLQIQGQLGRHGSTKVPGVGHFFSSGPTAGRGLAPCLVFVITLAKEFQGLEVRNVVDQHGQFPTTGTIAAVMELHGFVLDFL